MVIFMGTPEPAVPCLRAVVEEESGEVLVITQPDRPRGRSRRPQPPPVKVAAQELGLEVLQPERVSTPEMVALLRQREPEFMVVVAYGQILSPEVLAVPLRGCVNVHYSLLPKYRGAAPVQWAILRGETETGITTMLMDEGMDTGDLLLQRRVPIAPEDTAGTLTEKLARVAPNLLLQTLRGLRAGTLTPRPQDHAQATYAPRLRKSDGQIQWTRPSREVVNHVRGTNPWPGAFTYREGRLLKVWQATVVENFAGGGGIPGTVVEIRKNRGIVVSTADGAVCLERVQAEGGKRVRGDEYATGRRLAVGERLGLADSN